MNPYLQRCLELARIPGAAVEPNPRVGAVVVHDGRIIGEGWHETFGEAHAEVNAIRSVRDKALLPEATLYVSLEPCNHHGKTPACTGLILSEGIRHVVIGSLDPNPQMAGNSVRMLRKAGIKVDICPAPGPFHALNGHFFVNQTQGRPFVTLKWAQSADGFIAGLDPQGKPRRTAISGAVASRHTHALRAEHQAILIGRRTAEIDDPSLSTRKWAGPSPIPILLDPRLIIRRDAQLFAADKVIVVNEIRDDVEGNCHFMRVEVANRQDWKSIFETLYRRFGIGSILVEGGRMVHEQLLEARCFDAIWRNVSPLELRVGLFAPHLPALEAPRTFELGKGEMLEHYANCLALPAWPL